jgi:hypothetical protein
MPRATTLTALARTVSVLTAAAVLLVVPACSTQPPPAPAAPATLAPPPADPTAAEQADVQHAYEQFWAVSWSVSTVQPEQWQPRLQQVAAEPVLPPLLTSTRAHHDQGSKLYGAVTAHITDIRLAPGQATVADCQDASHAGLADATTGTPKTVGIARNPVRATLHRGPDNAWRVTGLEFPGGQC